MTKRKATVQTMELEFPDVEITTAELTMVLEAFRHEAHCYVKNHLLMLLTGSEGEFRDWHNSVTKHNLQTLTNLLKEIGAPLPISMELEARENMMKQKAADMKDKLTGLLSEGEALMDVKQSGQLLLHCYSEAVMLSTTPAIRKIFSEARMCVARNYEKVLGCMAMTELWYPPPMVSKVTMQLPPNAKPVGTS